jgi:serine/threonine protein kinase
VIGDFGFAKQGAFQTKTRLGTPITMAPELIMSKETLYTNKADLWSIGVVFYQMLFGVPPFDAKNYNDLKNKIKLHSGDRLVFPSNIPVSFQCRNLLVQLLQFDPEKRISWKDFYQHDLFKIHRNTNPQILQNSLLFRDNEDNVQKEFQINRENVE